MVYCGIVRMCNTVLQTVWLSTTEGMVWYHRMYDIVPKNIWHSTTEGMV